MCTCRPPIAQPQSPRRRSISSPSWEKRVSGFPEEETKTSDMKGKGRRKKECARGKPQYGNKRNMWLGGLYYAAGSPLQAAGLPSNPSISGQATANESLAIPPTQHCNESHVICLMYCAARLALVRRLLRPLCRRLAVVPGRLASPTRYHSCRRRFWYVGRKM